MNKSIQKLGEFLKRNDKFIISTHESPDADGLGSEIAFIDFLRQLGKTAIIFNSDPTPDICNFIDVDKEINILKDTSQLPDDIEEYSQFVLDTNDYDNIGSAYRVLSGLVKEYFIIDHHEGFLDKTDENYVKVESSSVAEIIFTIMEHYGVKLNFRTAQALFAGIVFDTGSFRYPKTTSETLRIASVLVSHGVNPFRVYEHLYESNSLASFQLRSMILGTMEVMHNGRMVIMKLTPEMVIETGGSFSEGEATINMPFTVKGVIASVLVKQDVNGPVKISMRTKGDLDVASIAIKNGGGGHKNAAGFKANMSFDQAYNQAILEMAKFFK